MKLLKSLAVCAVALLGANAANAQIKVYITGSTAFRGPTNTEINALISGSPTVASSNATLTSAGAVMWKGGNIGGTAVTVKAAWTGSAAGVQTVAGNGANPSLLVKFLVDTASGTSNLDPNSTSNPNPIFETAIPDVAMSDTLQSTTPFNGTVAGVSYQSLDDTKVGVVTFKWVASNGFPAGKTMTDRVARYIYSNLGYLPLSVLTGSHSDESKMILGLGRNPDSGTRLTTFAEIGYGVTGLVKQWKPTFSGSGATKQATSAILWPVETVNGISTGAAGNSGENSGGTLAGDLNCTLASGAYDPDGLGGFTAGYYVAYLGVNDGNSAINSVNLPGVELAHNGVTFSQAAVEEGLYTFWGFEHAMKRSNLGTGTAGGTNDPVKLAFYNSLVTHITGETSTQLNPNVALTDMQCTRGTDGGDVTLTFF